MPVFVKEAEVEATLSIVEDCVGVGSVDICSRRLEKYLERFKNVKVAGEDLE